jgi:predicted peptidase
MRRVSGVLLSMLLAASAWTGSACAADEGLPAGRSRAAGLPTGRSVHRLSFRDPLVDHVNYLLYIPTGYARDTASDWPLILFLHGSEQRGDDPALLDDMALLGFAERAGDFPFIAVVPQCPPNIHWPPGIVKEVLDSVESMLRIDRDRVYLTGFSMGGFGTWQTAAAFPRLFAAIAPICGFSDLPDAGRLAGIPVWAFHGEQDLNVPVTESRKMIDALRKSGADARLTIYPDLAHDCWTMTYRDSRLYLWFLDHSLSAGSRIAASSLSSDALLER